MVKHVVVTAVVSEGSMHKVLELSEQLSKSVKEEPGNVNYYTMRSVRNKAMIIFTGTWEDEVAFEAHMGSEHFKAIIPQIGEYLDSINVEICDNLL